MRNFITGALVAVMAAAIGMDITEARWWVFCIATNVAIWLGGEQ